MYGYTLERDASLEELPVNITEDHAEDAGGNVEKFSGEDISKDRGDFDECQIDRYLWGGKLRGDGP